jgi:hypothetical protein
MGSEFRLCWIKGVGLKLYRKSYYLLSGFLIILMVGCSPFGSTVKKTGPEQKAATVDNKSESRIGPTAAPNGDTSLFGIEVTAKPGEIRQWASSAQASSEYSNPNWSASQAVGKPNVETCGDNSSAWASKSDNTVEWIELTYANPVVPIEINIYQNYKPSQVVEVMLIATDGEKYIAWEGYPESIKNCPDLMTITVELNKKITVNKVLVTIDQRVNGWGWNEIDAVELVGTRP